MGFSVVRAMGTLSHCLILDACPHRRWSSSQPGACVTGGTTRPIGAVPYPPEVGG